MGPFRLKWDRHTEFTRFKFMVPGGREKPFAKSALEAVPDDWLAELKGQTIVAARAALVRTSRGAVDKEGIADQFFGGNTLVGAHITGGAGIAFTDFKIHD